jgi:hypothetical protein
MKKLILGGVVLCGLAAAGWYVFGPGSDMSGTYVGENDHQAFLVQIVEANGGQLSGFFEEADLTPDGQVEQDNVGLTGARDGKTFTVTLTPSGLARFFTQPIGLSGTYSGTSVSLIGQSGDFNLNLNLQKGDAQTYQGYVGALDKQAEAIQVQRAEAAARQRQIEAQEAAAQQAAAAAQDLEARIENDMKLYATMSQTLVARIPQLGELGNKLRNETVQMQAALAREQALGGAQSAAGSQIAGQIEYANGQEQYTIDSVQNHLTDVEQNGSPALLQKFQEHDAQCQQIGATSAGQATFNGPPQLLQDCIAMESATPTFKGQVNQLLAAYQALFATWQAENAKQQQIITQSER